jgi:RNA polymerase sigma-70 factor (ECF subfamily)
MGERADITGLLRELSQGRPEVLGQLMPVVYKELRRIAHAQLRRERPGQTLNTTALVHDAYIRLVDVRQVEWRDRGHFFAMAARLMRRVLIDYARAKKREKRGADAVHVPLVEALDVPVLSATDDLLALDEALVRLEARSERQCPVEETAAALGISVATVKRDWTFSRAWLNRDLASSDGGSAVDVQTRP